MDECVSLRKYIDNQNEYSSVKVQTFCRLMKKVSDAIEKEEKPIIKINLDDILINIKTGDIVLPNNLFSEDLEKTMAGINTGISLLADRKTSLEHKRVAFALMVLGWYCNPDHSAVMNDGIVLENFDIYISNVPEWLREFFIKVFRNMDYNISFSSYYKENFNDKIKNEVNLAFAPYNLNEEQLNKIYNLIKKDLIRVLEEGDMNEYI